MGWGVDIQGHTEVKVSRVSVEQTKERVLQGQVGVGEGLALPSISHSRNAEFNLSAMWASQLTYFPQC